MRTSIMKSVTQIIAAFAAVLLIGASPARAAGIKVVATTQDLENIVKEVGGDKVETESLAKGYQDPHFVEAKPSFILRLNRADLLVVVGRELEIGWLPALVNQARNAKIQPGADAFGLDVVGYVEPKPGIPPSPSHTLALIQQMKRDGVKLIIVEPYFDPKTPNSIGSQTGAQVVTLAPSVGGEKEVTDYFKLFD